MTKPLKGISLLSDYGNIGRWFRIDCHCGDSGHQLQICINDPKKEDGYALELFTNGISSSKITMKQRIKYVIDMLRYGKYRVESDTLLDKEMAVNVYNSLADAYIDVVSGGSPLPTETKEEFVLNDNGQYTKLIIDVEVGEMVGIFTEVVSNNDPYVTWKKRISMAWSMLTKGYYEVGIDLQLKPNDAIMFIQALSTLTTKLKT